MQKYVFVSNGSIETCTVAKTNKTKVDKVEQNTVQQKLDFHFFDFLSVATTVLIAIPWSRPLLPGDLSSCARSGSHFPPPEVRGELGPVKQS